MTRAAGLLVLMSITLSGLAAEDAFPIYGEERQVTQGPGGRILTNTSVWSPDSQWLVYDVRSDPSGDKFDGSRIEAIHAETGEIRVLYQSVNQARCGVATHHPHLPYVVFILGPEHPTPDWNYGPNHRQGVVVDTRQPGVITRLDARDLNSPLTPGALRGGTHVHVWDAAGDWLSFTYNDAMVEPGLRDIGISIPGHAVRVKAGHPRNHDGEWFSTLVTRTVAAPRPGSDEIKRANEEGWIGQKGYVRSDGSRQKRAIAFQGHVVTTQGQDAVEVFIVDLPDQLSDSSAVTASLSETGRIEPWPAAVQRRLTHTTDRKYPGIQGVRHWLRSSPDGSRIAFVMKDDEGVAQLWTVSPATAETLQVTRNSKDITSAFSWSPDGLWIAHALGRQVCLTNTATGTTHPIITRRGSSMRSQAGEIQKEACIISPDGTRIAFVRSKEHADGTTNQICVIQLEKALSSP